MELQSQNLFCVFIPICMYHSAFSWFKLGPPYSIEHSECCAYTSLHVASPSPPPLLKNSISKLPNSEQTRHPPIWLIICVVSTCFV